ncbi:MAG: LL-diaminopimelate aminotransferase [Eubacteriales bacterium]|nr:LL-diaminopimelate aminotransferase [Eubacteriales bacterium]
MFVNPHIAGLPGSYLFQEIDSRVEAFLKTHKGRPVLRLGIGDVTRPLPKFIAEKFAQAALNMATQEGFKGYPPGRGYPFLIKKILKNDYLDRGIALDEDEIFISDGAKTDAAAIQELFSSSARIAFTDPVYPVYVDSNAMAGRLGEYDGKRWAGAQYLPTTEENGFIPPLPSKNVDVLYLCYPNNPTGTVLTKEQLKKYVDWAKENDALIVFDAAYKAFISDDNIPRSIYEVEGAKDVAIECCSFSKTAGFTGVRCAYTVIPKSVLGLGKDKQKHSLNKMWARRIGSKSNGVSYPVQVAAAAVYEDEGKRAIEENIAYYMENANILKAALNDCNIKYFGGEHAPYIWLKAPNQFDSWGFFDYLLNTCQIVGTPGVGFGPSGENYFRLTAFGERKNAEEAAKRIRDTFKEA